ncbi:MAG TPA: flagellar basal body protein [Acidimicrobiia bacterium]|jgi:flagellar basal-body rod protein FlgC|nr:flagellar basal body protein [Acidimicrobiia bacterium]
MSSLFPTFDIASSALTTHRIWMNAIADNIANVNTVKPMSGAAYQEKFIVAQEIPSAPGQPVGVGGGVQPVAVQYGDATGMVTYDPTNPLADKNGLVRRPSENLGDQMTNLIIAQRGYQLNLAVIDRAKSSYQQALDINGR